MYSIRRRAAVAVALAGLTVSVLSACGSDGGASGDTPTPVAGASSRDGLTIGISFDQPGLGLKSGDTYTGFDVDTAKYVAKALGVSEDKITWREADPADRESLLEDGQVDLVFSSYSITDERKKQVAFAGPYFLAHQDLLIRRNDVDITGPETLNGRTLCSVTGTTSAALVKKKYQGKITLKEFPKFSDCVEALAAGQIDAVTTDDVILAGFAAESKYKGVLKVVGDGFSDERYGVGIKLGDSDLVKQVNSALKQYIDSGAWKKNLDATVGDSGYSLPDPPTPGTA